MLSQSSNNAGKRKLNDNDLILLFLARLRRGIPFEFLSMLFGVSHTSCSNYFNEILRVFTRQITPRLFALQDKETIMKNVPRDFKEKFPFVLFLMDALPLGVKMPETFVLNRLTWSCYKHKNCFLLVAGKFYYDVLTSESVCRSLLCF